MSFLNLYVYLGPDINDAMNAIKLTIFTFDIKASFTYLLIII